MPGIWTSSSITANSRRRSCLSASLPLVARTISQGRPARRASITTRLASMSSTTSTAGFGEGDTEPAAADISGSISVDPLPFVKGRELALVRRAQPLAAAQAKEPARAQALGELSQDSVAQRRLEINE